MRPDRPAALPRVTRRALGAPLGAAAIFGLVPGEARQLVAAEPTVPENFPSQDLASVRDTVLYAHSDLERVRGLVEAQPALANAAIDWGFGDWESALGAAAHMGRRDIAELLLEHGARPDLFAHAMLGHLDAVRGAIEAQPGVQGIDGPHGITLLAHAKAGGEGAQRVVDFLEELGGADPSPGELPLVRPSAAYLGTFAWTARPEDRVAVAKGRFGLGLQRGDGFPRVLVHVGEDTFYPSGSRAVRVRFEVAGERADALEIEDGALRLRAERVSD